MNPSERELRQKSLAVRFPFEQVLNDRVKLKYAPIEFQWNIQENPDKITEPLAFAQIMEKKPDMWGYRRQNGGSDFRQPPKVAKESADVIILDDNFSTIATVAKWGRSVYINIQKFVQFQLTVNVVALIVNFSSACLIGSAPLTAVQLLWVNMIMDTLGALALATEPPNNELMKRTPVGRKGNFISNVMWRNIMGQAIYQFLVIWYLQAEGKWLFAIEGDNSDLVLNTIIFNCFVFCQVFNEVSSREMERINVFQGILDNNVFAAVLGSTVVFQFIIIQFLGNFANTTPLTFTQWIASIFIGFIGMPIAVAVKMVPVDSA
ncbi:calcium-transporting ATPase 2, plasma membrane-type-like [Panicum virgatum]|uniref:calcium-transporting ATPase 2, plasma membrane-type-like n=1 Tax=Panicum virgatum TaxID=38727 RepID=UPI0019D59DCF|nr:calcium-transporting ATPase 2, plasma membrane-type-like [Panicum virgatum]